MKEQRMVQELLLVYFNDERMIRDMEAEAQSYGNNDLSKLKSSTAKLADSNNAASIDADDEDRYFEYFFPLFFLRI